MDRWTAMALSVTVAELASVPHAAKAAVDEAVVQATGLLRSTAT